MILLIKIRYFIEINFVLFDEGGGGGWGGVLLHIINFNFVILICILRMMLNIV